MPTRFKVASSAALLFSALAVLSVIPLSGCLAATDDGCFVEGVTAENVTVTAGNASATITWEIPAFDTSTITTVWAQVQYDTAGGEGAQCHGYHPNDLAPGCAVACQLSGSTQCTATGLQNGRSYTFTVVTQASSPNPYCGNGTGFTRSQAATPVAP